MLPEDDEVYAVTAAQAQRDQVNELVHLRHRVALLEAELMRLRNEGATLLTACQERIADREWLPDHVRSTFENAREVLSNES